MNAAVKRVCGDLSRTESAIGVVNAMGAHIPATAPGLGAGICKVICAKLSGWFSFCVWSSVAAWVIGIAAFVVIGEFIRAVVVI